MPGCALMVIRNDRVVDENNLELQLHRHNPPISTISTALINCNQVWNTCYHAVVERAMGGGF